ncbi:hypothetical protein Tco_0479061 [Tanacetum coccineum]
MAYYYKKPNTDLDNGLKELAIDKDVLEMLNDVEVDVSKDEWLHKSLKKLGKMSKKFDQAIRNEVEVDNNGDRAREDGADSEDGSDSDNGTDSKDNDFIVDEENMIDDVEVHMADFKGTHMLM